MIKKLIHKPHGFQRQKKRKGRRRRKKGKKKKEKGKKKKINPIVLHGHLVHGGRRVNRERETPRWKPA